MKKYVLKIIKILLIGIFSITFYDTINFVYAVDKVTNTQLEDGIYIISAKIDESKVLEIPNKSKDDGEKIRLANKASVKKENQEIRVTTLENGYYKLTFEHSGKVFDVPGASTKSEVQLQQYTNNETIAQQWIIKETEDGYYYIISKCSGLYVDIPGGNAVESSIIQLYEGNNTDAQKFNFTKVEELKSDKIKEGNYYIESALGEGKVISIEDGKYNNFANAHLWDNMEKEYQKFEFRYNTDFDTYTITALHSNKSLDVSYAIQENGANVAQYDTHKDESQQWILKETGDGYYYIVSRCNYLNLDINAGQSANGTNAQMYEGNGTNAQKFRFIKIEEEERKQTIEDGTYNIISQIDNNKVIQIDEKAKITDKLNIINQKQSFEVKYLNNGYYVIRAKKHNYNLEVENGSQNNCAKIVQKPIDDKLTTQQWIIKEAGNEYYYIISRCNGLYIDVPGGSAENNPQIQMYEGNGTNAQKFKFEKATDRAEGEKVLENGIYKINTALDESKCIDVSRGSYDNGANVQIWDKSKVQQQKFQLEYNENEKFYEIKSVNSGKVLDIQSNGKIDGTNVWQYESNGSDAQKWILKEAGNEYYYIIAANSYLYLDVNAARTDNGTNIQIYEGNGTKAQKFKFEKITMIEPDSYNIEIKQDRKKVLDISAGSTNEGANVQIWEFDGVNQQVFKVEYIDNTYFKIIAKHSNKVLTVTNGNVVQQEYKNIDSQKWSFEIAGNGYYKIKSKENELYITVYGNKTENGTNVQVDKENTSNAQKFKIRKSITFERGTYGESGLVKAGDLRGSQLEYYRYGDGPNVFFATFTLHGFEDNWAHDGEALVNIANKFYKELKNNHTEEYNLAEKWTIYILPEINPDGRRYGTTNNGPGRTTLYSEAPEHKGIDMNRSWKTSGFNANAKSRNYAGTAPYQAYEAQALRDFLINNKSQNGQTVLVDLHGWLQQLIGNSEIASYYGEQFPESNTKSLDRYGDGYLIGWARTALASNGRLAKTALIEMPRDVYNHNDVERQNLANRYISATLSMLYGVN